MENYNFWADLLSTFRSMPDWIKVVWLVIPPVFVLGLVGLVFLFRRDDRASSTFKVYEGGYLLDAVQPDQLQLTKCNGREVTEIAVLRLKEGKE